MRKAGLALLVSFTLSACATSIDWDTAREMSAQGSEVVPRVSTKSALAVFDKYCNKTNAIPGRVVAAAKSDGYKLLITNKRERLFGYVHPTRPMVAVIDNPTAPACFTTVRRDPNLTSAFNNFVRTRHRNAQSISIPGLDTALRVNGNPQRTYIREVDGTDEVLMLIVE